MTPDSYHDFFVAAASAAAALIGLLFVAITVAATREETPAQRIRSGRRAAASLTAFSNVLSTSLIALIPDTNAGYPATVIGALGVLFALSSARVLFGHGADGRPGRAMFVLGQLVLFGFQLWFGIRALVHPGEEGALGGISGVMVASLSVGVSRAWDLVGFEDVGMFQSMRLLFRGEQHKAEHAE